MNGIPLRIQDLSPLSARYVLTVEHYISHYIPSLHGTTLFIACSGGVDSLSLLFTIYYLRKRLGCALHVLHCNHMLREEASREEQYVRKISRLLGLPYSSCNIDVTAYAREYSIGIEEAGRICRYRYCYDIMQSCPTPAFLCTGHHINDVAEDMIMRLIRGTSLDMLCGMPAFSQERQLLRPLLSVPKEKLYAFLNDINVTWNEDYSNYDHSHLRSRIRMTILPLLIKENPLFLDSIHALHMQTEWDIAYWENVLSHYNAVKISHKDLLSLHKAGRMRLYRKACVQCNIQANFMTLLALDDAVIAKQQKQFTLPQHVTAYVTATELIFSKQNT